MDFDPTPEQAEAAALARRILTDRCTPERLAEVEATGRRFDEALWRELGDAGLLGIGLPEELGGGGLGLLETCSVLEEVGRAVAPLPLAWHAVAADALARFGTTEINVGLLGASAQVIILERPLGIAAFLTAIEAALRNRRRQYEVKHLLSELDDAAREVAGRSDRDPRCAGVDDEVGEAVLA